MSSLPVSLGSFGSSIKSDNYSLKSVLFDASSLKCSDAGSASPHKYIKILPKLLASVYGSVLRCAVYELAIIDRVSKLPPEDATLDCVTLSEKFQINSFEIEDDNDDSYSSLIRNRKFQKDRTYLEKTFKLTAECLENYFSYDVLAEIVQNFKISKTDEHELLSECEKNSYQLNRLRCLVDEDRENYLTAIQQTTDNIGNHKDEINDLKFEIKARKKFLSKWEDSRREQHDAILANQENNFLDTMRNSHVQINQEERIHTEIAAYLRENSYDNEHETEMWMERYDKELDQREIDINEIKIQIERQQDNHAKLLQEFNQRQQKIDDYLIHKKQRKAEEEEFSRRTDAAIRIQAWWRGTMFRRELGPYKKKPKGKKGSGDKKGKKKF